MRHLAPVLIGVCLASFANAQSILAISDDFNGPTLDSTKWTTITAGIPAASVTQGGGVVTLQDEGYLRTNAQIDPLAVGGVRVHGHWRFDSTSADAGVLTVLTRTDAVPDPTNFNQATNGLDYNLWLGPNYQGVAAISPRGNSIQVGPNAVTGSLHWTNGAWYEFDALDSGPQASWTIRETTDPSNTITVTCSVSAPPQPLNYVAIHGREQVSGDNICDLDDMLVALFDCNGNQVADGVDISNGTSTDCDGDLVPDECQIAQTPSLDLNSNGILDSCECLSSTYCIAAPNSVGSGAHIGFAGTLSIGLNNLNLVCTGLPPNSSGLFFYGPGQTQTPFGNGIRCVAGSITRTPVTIAGPSGIASRSINFATLPQSGQITVGSTRNFQYWYRNPAAGGAGFNLSDGLHATFCP